MDDVQLSTPMGRIVDARLGVSFFFLGNFFRSLRGEVFFFFFLTLERKRSSYSSSLLNFFLLSSRITRVTLPSIDGFGQVNANVIFGD